MNATTTPRRAGRTAVSRLCCDDVIRSTRPGRRFVRIDSVRQLPDGAGWVMDGHYLDTGTSTLVVLDAGARPTRYVA